MDQYLHKASDQSFLSEQRHFFCYTQIRESGLLGKETLTFC